MDKKYIKIWLNKKKTFSTIKQTKHINTYNLCPVYPVNAFECQLREWGDQPI